MQVNFAPSLSYLTKLDLSKNQLTELPENFGDLAKLKHLDLYQNQLQHLPLSFSKLKALKWLDLKDNPLVPAVAKVSGQCLDSKQCQTCAKDVVKFFTQVQEQITSDLENRQKIKEKQIQINHQKEMENKKNKKKEKSKQQKKENGLLNEASLKPLSKKAKKPTVVEKEAKNSSCLGRFICSITILALTALFVLTSVKYKHTTRVEDGVVDLYGRGLKSLPPNVQIYVETVGNYVQFVHSKTGNVTLEAVDYLTKSDNFVNAYNTVAAYIESLLQTVKEQYKKYV